MSTQSIINNKNLPTSEVVATVLSEEAIDLLKYLRFEIGCSNHYKMRELMLLERLVCADICYITEEQERSIREDIIRKSISKLNEI